MGKLTLTVAVERYDRHVPLTDGRVQDSDLDLRVLVVPQHRVGRHDRMLHHQEFDVCEFSLATFLTLKSRGNPLVGIPIFPRRLFSQTNWYVHRKAGIESPGDLRGKRVAINCFQTTISVLGKGDLQTIYGVPLDSVEWVCIRPEPEPISPPPGVRITYLPQGESVDDRFAAGDIDAMLTPQPPRPIRQGIPAVRRLFADTHAEEAAYFRQRGFWPIMHLLVARPEWVQRHPWVLRNIYDLFERAKQQCYQDYELDPNFSCLAWGQAALRDQQTLMGPDPWPNGVQANLKNLEQFVTYAGDQGLLARPLEVAELFYRGLLDT